MSNSSVAFVESVLELFLLNEEQKRINNNLEAAKKAFSQAVKAEASKDYLANVAICQQEKVKLQKEYEQLLEAAIEVGKKMYEALLAAKEEPPLPFFLNFRIVQEGMTVVKQVQAKSLIWLGNDHHADIKLNAPDPGLHFFIHVSLKENQLELMLINHTGRDIKVNGVAAKYLSIREQDLIEIDESIKVTLVKNPFVSNLVAVEPQRRTLNHTVTGCFAIRLQLTLFIPTL